MGSRNVLSNGYVVRWLRIRLKKIILPGFQGVSLYDSAAFFFEEIFSMRFNLRAQAVSFSFLMSFPPFLLFLFSLVPYLPISSGDIIHGTQEMIASVTDNPNIHRSVTNLITDFFNHKKQVLVSFSVLLTLYYASNGMVGLMSSFDKQNLGFREPVWWKQRLIAVALTFLWMAVFLVTIAIFIFQNYLLEWLGFESSEWLLRTLESMVMLVVLLNCISIIYRFGPATESKWPFYTPGSIMATVLIILVTFIFFYAVNNFINYNEIYGSIGTMIVFLVWIYSISLILLIGFELNASIYINKARRLQSLRDEED